MAEKSPDYLVVNGEKIPQQTLQAGAETYEPVKEKSGIWRNILRILLFSPRLSIVVLIGIPGLVLSTQWKTVEKYFPKVNDFIHSNVKDDNDVDYQSYKLRQALDAYQKAQAVCDVKETTMAKCREAIIGGEPALEEISERASKLSEGFTNEERARSMPLECRTAGEALFRNYARYVLIEKQVIAQARRLDVKSAQSLTEASSAFDQLAKAEDSALKGINTPWPKECSDY
jgi:hypothetical protein